MCVKVPPSAPPATAARPAGGTVLRTRPPLCRLRLPLGMKDSGGRFCLVPLGSGQWAVCSSPPRWSPRLTFWFTHHLTHVQRGCLGPCRAVCGRVSCVTWTASPAWALGLYGEGEKRKQQLSPQDRPPFTWVTVYPLRGVLTRRVC